MTTTYFEVMFSVGEISVESSFCQDGGSLVMNEWINGTGGKSFYFAETLEDAHAALQAKIEDVRGFLLQAELKYA